MTTTTYDSAEPENKQGGFLSRMFNKITAPVREWVNELHGAIANAPKQIEQDERLENSTRIKDAENIFIDAFYNAENTTEETLRNHIETIIKNDNQLQGLGYTVDEVIELSQTLREENTAQLSTNRAINLEPSV